MLTGIEDDNATCDMCLKAYADAAVARAGNGSARFKHVESNFVKALTRGYIVEIQEISRIKDAGVLVGLNEYDRPGAIIPLVDGSFKRRHPDAMVVYTDNVGYASCRAIDPSVLRRMSIIIDSYDMPRADVIARVLYNTDFPDSSMLDQMYDVWSAIQEYCQEHDISDGTVSVTELEMWALAVKVDNMSNHQGLLPRLRCRQSDLRPAGAGSDYGGCCGYPSELSYKRSLKFQAPLSERSAICQKEILRLGYVR